METDKKHYHFINIQTGNTIAHYSIDVELPEEDVIALLEGRRKTLAVENKIFVDTIYWKIAKEE